MSINRRIANLASMLGVLGIGGGLGGAPGIPIISGKPKSKEGKPGLLSLEDTDTRQAIRRRLFFQHFVRVPPNVIPANPIPSRRERRNLARAKAVGEWRLAKPETRGIR
jgi:hypothetical protein